MTDLFGKRIAALRKMNGFSQGQLVQQPNVSPRTIGMYEPGRRAPSLELIVELVRTLSVSPDFLLPGHPASPVKGDNTTKQQLICTNLLLFGGKICLEPYCKCDSSQ